jgi:broad specificity phosphatase PhoE
MKEIRLVRHPEVDRLQPPICYGQHDLALTPRGVEMIDGLVTQAEQWQPEVILSSDLSRCLLPAQAIAAQCGVACEVSSVWREISLGQWEGLPWHEVERDNAEMLQNWMQNYVRVAAPGGETYEQLAERVFPAFNALQDRPEKKLWLMTHGGVIRVLVSRILGVSLEQSWAIETDYAGGVLVRFKEGHWKVIFTGVACRVCQPT